jgi:hypothetical protein
MRAQSCGLVDHSLSHRIAEPVITRRPLAPRRDLPHLLDCEACRYRVHTLPGQEIVTTWPHAQPTSL